MRIMRPRAEAARPPAINNLRRKGAFLALALVTLITSFVFMSLSVDLGLVALTKTRMQNAVDAAALAAAQEITVAVEEAGEQAAQEGAKNVDVNAYAQESARDMAVNVAELNSVFVDRDSDVRFGKRVYDEATETWSVVWGATPSNVVGVSARKDNPAENEPDSMLELFFAGIMGESKIAVQTEAVAYVQARDLVMVLDYSGSMSYDSQFRSESFGKLGQPAVEDNMEAVYEALGPPNLGSMGFEPQWLTVNGPDPESAGQARVDVTFQNTSAYVTSTKPILEVELEFSDGDRETIQYGSESSGAFSGSGGNAGKTIDTVWVTSGVDADESVRVNGKEPKDTSQPQIYVTFEGIDEVFIESSKDLSNVVLEFADGTEYKFDGLTGLTGTFSGVGENEGKEIVGVWVKSGSNESGDGPGYGERFDNPNDSPPPQVQRFDDTIENVKAAFGLNDVEWPWPSGSWDEFLNYVRYDDGVEMAGYRRKYGGMPLVDYLLSWKTRYSQCPDLWKTPHYPFHAMKNGATLLSEFLEELNFGDQLGLVTYDTYHRVETVLDEDGIDEYVDISNEPLTRQYSKIDAIQRHKQSGHYNSYTNLGGGLSEAKDLLEEHARYGSRPTILLMTDGNPNVRDGDWSQPGDWDFNELTDYDGDGSADYTTSNSNAIYAMDKARQAAAAGFTVHTLSVGANADRDLMRAIAFIGRGHWIDVPGGTTIEEMEDEARQAFSKIAADVPPARLFNNGAGE